MPCDKWISLGTTDKQCAEKKARDFVAEKEREAAGILEPRILRDAAKKLLNDHLADYVRDLEKRQRAGRGGRGGRLLGARITKLISECGWSLPGQVSPDTFTAWRSMQSSTPRTLNHYLQGMVSFLNWMERTSRIKANPLRLVQKIDERGYGKRQRRAFTDDELRKLVWGSGPRGIIYLMAGRTGLRQEELRQLTWNDVQLDSEPPAVVVRAETAKNKKRELVPLIPDVVEELRKHRPAKASSTDLVFQHGIPRASRLKVDAEKNGIQYRDELGRYADFHALRYTFATFLQRHGVPVRFAMKLMRHSDVKLTVKHYADETQFPIYDSIKALPSLLGYTQIRAQISGAEGQNGAVPVAIGESLKLPQTPIFAGAWQSVTGSDAVEKMERAKGFEPSTFTLAR